MKTIQEQIAVMQHFAAGGKVECMDNLDRHWGTLLAPVWNWERFDYRIAEEADPYAELKAANTPGSGKQIKCNDAVGIDWQDAGYKWKWSSFPHRYEIRDKPKPMKKVKLLAWFDGDQLFWLSETAQPKWPSKRVPSKDMEIEVEDD